MAPDILHSEDAFAYWDTRSDNSLLVYLLDLVKSLL